MFRRWKQLIGHRRDNELDILMVELQNLVRQGANSAWQAELCQRILDLDAVNHRLSASIRAKVLIIFGNALETLAERRGTTEATRLLEQALSCFNRALEICDRTTMAFDHAGTQQNKGNVLARLAERRGGAEVVQVLEQALACYDIALQIYDRMGLTSKYANTQQNKGNTLHILAEKSERAKGVLLLEQAIACFDIALETYDPIGMAPDYAMAQMNKGNALARLGEWQGGANGVRLLEQALTCYDIALETCDRTTMVFDYVGTQLNKGNAQMVLAERREGVESAQLLEQAIDCYDFALKIYDRNGLIPQYAGTQQNKGVALRKLAERREGTEAMRLLKEAINCHDIALTYYDRTTTPSQYAGTQSNKGNALQMLAKQHAGMEAVAWLEQAIICYDIALEISNSPKILWDLGNALSEQAGQLRLALGQRGSETESLLKQATECYEIALGHIPQAVMPREYRTLALLLARARLAHALGLVDPAPALAQAWSAAAVGLETARLLERQAPSLEFRQEEWIENAKLYIAAGTIQALRGAIDEAVALLEAGRTRGLIEAQGRRLANLSVLNAAERQEYGAAVKEVLDIEAWGRQGGDFHRSLSVATEAEKANATLTAVVERLQKAHPSFLPENHITIETLAAGLRRSEVLIYLIPQDEGTLLVTVSKAAQARAEWLSELRADQLFYLVMQADKQIDREIELWTTELGWGPMTTEEEVVRGLLENEELRDLILQTDQPASKRQSYLPAALDWGRKAFDEALDALLPALGRRLMHRVAQVAREFGAKRVVLVPGGLLAVLPLHAATYMPLTSDDSPTAPNGQRYACDDLVITYTPSGAAYLAARTASVRTPTLRQGLVVGNPKLTPSDETRWEQGMPGYLPNATSEAETVATVMLAAGLRVISKIGAEATWRAIIDSLSGVDVAHLAMHAVFDSSDPLISALLVAPGARLFLRDLLDARLVSLTHLRLAVLSACQSGLADFQRLHAEAMGFFGALLAAGAAGVVGSLWPVYDYSTKLLMEAFMQRYLQEGQEPDIALRNAIRWLRGLPDEFIESSLEKEAKKVRNQHPSAQERWRESDPPVPTMLRQASGDQDDEASSLLKAQLRTSLEHPIHWAAFIYYGA